MGKYLPVRETITYPKFTVTSQNDPCHSDSSPFEHVLDCGHLITTPAPGEPCAPNCHHANSDNPQRVRKISLAKALKKDFYCDACVEVEAETEVSEKQSCKGAEKRRIEYRRLRAENQGKAKSYRKCYIAQKIVSVLCDEDGEIDGYDPYPSGHPFDTAWPPTGGNIFEDVEVTPSEPTFVNKEPFDRSSSLPTPVDDSCSEASDADEAVVEDVDETLEEGARWLRELEERERRHTEDVTRRRRAAAQPVVTSSSPITETSNFIDNNSSPQPVQSSSPISTPTPVAAPSKKRDRKRKRTVQVASAAQPVKRKETTIEELFAPRLTNSHGCTAPAVSPTKKAKATAPTSATKSTKKSSKRVCTVL